MKRRYVKGKKFWSIDHTDTSVTVTEGDLGTPGKSKTWTFKDRKKTIAGWSDRLGKALAAGFKPPKLSEHTNAELEAAIRANPDDDAAYAVYADWLQTHEQPRGKLAAVQAAIAKLPKGKPAHEPYQCSGSPKREVWHLPSKAKGAKKLFDEHVRLLAEHALDAADYDLAEATLRDYRPRHRFDWRHGFVRAAWFDLGGSYLDRTETVAHAVGHPSCRFLRSLTLAELHDDGFGDKSLAAIAKVAPKTLRHLHLGDFSIGSPEISWINVGNVSPFYKATPDLTTLLLQGAAIELGTSIDLPKLEYLEIRTGGLSKKAARAIAASKLPALKTLIVWFGDRDYGATASIDDIQPIFDGKHLPKVTHLGLANAEFTNAIAPAIVKSKILEQLRVLDLSRGTLDDEGAKLLATGKRALAHLDVLDLSDNYLTKAGAKLVKGLAKRVLLDDQREPYDWDETKRRYADVGE